MQTENDLLVFFLDGNEAHVGPGDGFADGGGIGGIVLAAYSTHAVGTDELGRHEPDGVTVKTKLSCPVVRAGAGLHADDAGRELYDQFHQVLTLDLGLDQYRLAAIIHAMHSKHVLGEIDSYSDNVHGLPLSWFDVNCKLHHGTCCRLRLPPLPRDGEVPFIR